MSQINKVLLKPSSISAVPLQTYDKDFSFVVNGKEFKTSRLLSDLLSPIICKIQLNDPTIDTFIINTNQNGDFSHFLQLTNFEPTTLIESINPFFFGSHRNPRHKIDRTAIQRRYF